MEIEREQTEEGLPATDRELLARFMTQRDEAAFRELVTRHSPLIWNVCRRMLPSRQDQEDVFQATFLKLVMHASKTSWRETIGGWLYKVAYRLSLKTLQKRKRSHETEIAAEPWIEDESLQAIQQQDAELSLHQVLLQLPQTDREAVILCCLQKKTREEAAAELGCSVTTLMGRLQRGRRKLLARLGRRGLTVSLTLVALERSLQAAPHTLPPLLIENTVSTGSLLLKEGLNLPVSPDFKELLQGDYSSMVYSGIVIQSLISLSCFGLFCFGGSSLLSGVHSSMDAHSTLLAGSLSSPATEDSESLAVTSNRCSEPRRMLH